MSETDSNRSGESGRIAPPVAGQPAPVDAASPIPAGNALNVALTRELHELLGAISAFAELVKAQARNQPDVQENIDHLARAVHRAQGLIAQAEVWSRKLLQRGHPLQLGPILTATADLLRTFAPPRIRFEVSIEPDLPMVLADSVQMHQLLLHLGLRALHALQGSEGRLSACLDELEVSEETSRAQPGLTAGHYVLLTFQDTGRSLDTEYLQRAIAAVPSADQRHDPIAASLAAAQIIIAAHQGVLEVQAEPGGGTTVQVFLPAHATSRDPLLPSATPRGSGEQILVVDDDPAQGDVTGDLLRRLGFNPRVFNDPVEALADFLTRAQTYAAAFLDLEMPGMTGVDLATQLLDHRRDLPVYLVTGHEGDWTPDMAHNLGIRGVLTKPLSAGIWCTTLDQAVHPQT